MKWILCGKGGSGKSTVAALMARAYEKAGRQVLVVDSDESNFGLHRQLGLPLPEDFTHYFGHKKGIFRDGAEAVFEGGWHLEDLPEDYVSRDGAVRLMAIGKIHDAGEGCACAMGALAKVFLEHLTLRENEVVIVDTEAGVEHMGRGVDQFADAILMVADPSFESIQLSKKIGDMAKSIGKPFYIVLNKADAQQREIMAQQVDAGAILTSLPADSEILTAGLLGRPLRKTLPEIEAILKIG